MLFDGPWTMRKFTSNPLQLMFSTLLVCGSHCLDLHVMVYFTEKGYSEGWNVEVKQVMYMYYLFAVSGPFDYPDLFKGFQCCPPAHWSIRRQSNQFIEPDWYIPSPIIVISYGWEASMLQVIVVCIAPLVSTHKWRKRKESIWNCGELQMMRIHRDSPSSLSWAPSRWQFLLWLRLCGNANGLDTGQA